ncbi:MAG: septum formation initiator family protein [Paracoccaceae bacterium]|nr:MAG: septum formation initiator family protein [Paracoccaceae bacterium]
MSNESSARSLASLALAVAALTVGAYFTFAAVQGEYGVFRQIQIAADSRDLTAKRDALATELATLENLTRRLSDEFLDIDLLDERARDVLGYMRADEIVIR